MILFFPLSYGDPLLDLSCLESSPLTKRWMFCSSLVDSFSEHIFGERETDPKDIVEDLLLTSEAESIAAEIGLVAMLLGLGSPALLAIVCSAVVRRVLLSGRPMGME